MGKANKISQNLSPLKNGRKYARCILFFKKNKADSENNLTTLALWLDAN